MKVSWNIFNSIANLLVDYRFPFRFLGRVNEGCNLRFNWKLLNLCYFQFIIKMLNFLSIHLIKCCHKNQQAELHFHHKILLLLCSQVYNQPMRKTDEQKSWITIIFRWMTFLNDCLETSRVELLYLSRLKWQPALTKVEELLWKSPWSCNRCLNCWNIDDMKPRLADSAIFRQFLIFPSQIFGSSLPFREISWEFAERTPKKKHWLRCFTLWFNFRILFRNQAAELLIFHLISFSCLTFVWAEAGNQNHVIFHLVNCFWLAPLLSYLSKLLVLQLRGLFWDFKRFFFCLIRPFRGLKRLYHFNRQEKS